MIWNKFFWDLEIWKRNLTFWKKATFSTYQFLYTKPTYHLLKSTKNMKKRQSIMYIPASTYSTLTIRTGGTWRRMNPTQNTTKQAESMMMQTRELDIQRFWRPGTRKYYLTLIINSSDVFTNLFPQFCPIIFLSLSSWKRKQISYWSKIVLQLKKKS